MTTVPSPSTDRRILAWRVVLVACLSAVAVFGASRLAFLCDDAYITFRHVSNAMDGHGLVWNAPPFEPVEGYTGFLWAILLWMVWAWCGVEPPAAANGLSIACGVLTFWLVAVAAFRLRDRRGLASTLVAAVCLAVLVGHRTFLQWMTGGLETALFNLAFTGWVLLAFRAPAGRDGRWLATWSTLAVMAALTRPDGLLLVAATAAVAVTSGLLRRLAWRVALLGITPLLAVGLHVLWRRSFYGEWLPNTYFAKVTAPWPEAGWRYLYCFTVESGLWVWVLLALVWAVVRGVRAQTSWWQRTTGHLPAVAAVAATVVHVGFYVLRIGGDHFEYRVLSHLVPLMVLSTAAMALQLWSRRLVAVALLGLLALAGGVGWLQLALTRPLGSTDYDRLSTKLPAWAGHWLRDYDRHHAWLLLHFVCMRCETHHQNVLGIAQVCPERQRTPVDPTDVPIVKSVAVGLVGWVLPDAAVIDLLGLNDWVTARTPLASYNVPYLPKELLQAAVAGADADHDGAITSGELAAAFAASPPFTQQSAARLAELMVFLFATAEADRLNRDEADRIEQFVANLRWIAHERQAPPAYVADLDPNVTIEDRKVVIRRRSPPMGHERLREIERKWRQWVLDGAR
jgi:arabinofuranosyltransferase